ncbi:ArsR/SmtB family transcription factor [Jannaschia sp. CCS1]|uniref:ArsR/SmtB family transcription factor n=1 Tax=Jannaschia sp. (strain CCS1) TaxID=290400 RepID=UPI000053D2E1|nr:metalloregulator ArsR/SmtB family transcription factor [Jannaschia sp. CCS1]ABD53479.1 transcriptional regulator, ArsR family [Jannaschia sp. CCS1]
MDSHDLDLVFSALADPIRRGILVKLSDGEQNVRQITAAFDVSQPAISRHLRTLGKAGLIRKDKRGREQFIRVNADPAEEAAAWVGHYTRFWKHHFDQVEDILAQTRKDTEDDNGP